MAEPYSITLRERVVAAYEAGAGSYPEVAERFSLGEATVKRWVWLKRKTGALLPSPKGGGTPSEVTAEDLSAMVARLGDPTATELTVEYNRGRSRAGRIHVSSMKRALHRHGYVVKKSADGRWRVCGRMSLRSATRS